jgi:thymidylate kinase
MLIIEGSDLLGKTTLCKALVNSPQLRSQGYIYKHFTRLPHEFNYFWGYVQHAAKYSVQDRFHMSEIVYASTRYEQPQISPEMYRLVDGYLRSLGCFTVVLTADEEVFDERFHMNGQEQMYNLDQIKQANFIFAGIAQNCELTTVTNLFKNIDIDGHIHFTKENPWPGQRDLDNILTAYLRRQSILDLVHQRKPSYEPLYGR